MAILSFPVLLFYRTNIHVNDVDFSSVIETAFLYVPEVKLLILDLISDRMNYAGVLQRVILKSQYWPESFDYIQNTYGMIPRLIWDDKPLLGLDMNAVGKNLNIISINDFKTSIGLTVIGESYMQLKHYGLSVAFVQGFVMSLFYLIFRGLDSFTVSVRSYLLFTFIILDSYLSVIPMFVRFFLVIFIILYLPRKLRF